MIHLDLPESKTTKLREYLKITSAAAALEADRERAIKDKLNGFGYTTTLGGGINREKEFKEKISKLKKREQVIHSKFNRELVGDITHLDGDSLTGFIAFCDFNEEFLYETDVYTIIEALFAKLNDYQSRRESNPSDPGL